MSHWPFIIAAYAIGLGATAVLILWSWRAMARAERDAEQLRGRE